MKHRLAFLCLGAMGRPIAGHLAAAGHDVCVWNRTPRAAEDWRSHHAGRVAATPAEAAAGAEVVFACTGDDAALREICGENSGAFAGMRAGTVFVDHTTVSAETTRELARLAAERGIEFIDAPVSGGEEGAQRGSLTVMAGGPSTAFERVRPLLDCYAKTAVHLGPSGAGQLTKMVNQICIAGVVQGLAEGIAFAERVGLDPAAVVEVVSSGAAGSWQMANRSATMIEGRYDFGFAVDWMRKDLGIALAEARRSGAALPLAALVDQFYASLQARGMNRADTSSLIELLRAGGALAGKSDGA